ncbi:MAG: metalloregulator ArsR/SmtB family transcription factor [Micrococcales bacterium]|nr:metalloregulator ArsR/SmtB family transcription factor [Micrococcales bacterium]
MTPNPTPTGTPCCTPPTSGTLTETDAARLAGVFRALGDPARLTMLSIIATAHNHEACICELTEATGLAQSTVSHHMRQLADVNLVTREQRGKWAYFTPNLAALDAATRALAQHASTQLKQAARRDAPAE